jgi:predicted RNase H-like HicB family nuclease
MDRQTFRVHPERDGKFWLVRIPELPRIAAQARRLDQVEDVARDAIALWFEIPEKSFDLAIDPPDFDEAPLQVIVDEARAAREQAEEARRRAQQLTPRAVRAMLRAGYPLRDVATAVGISFQRVAQLAREPSSHTKWSEIKRQETARQESVVETMAASKR